MFVRNKSQLSELPIEVAYVYSYLSSIYSGLAKISDFWQLLKNAYQFGHEFSVLDFKVIQNGSFDAYIMDTYSDWCNGKDVDFEEIHEAIETAGNFTATEKLLFSDNDIEKRLWAIYIFVSNPGIDNIKQLINKTND